MNSLQDWMRKNHPYVFTMGGGQFCTDFPHLMEVRAELAAAHGLATETLLQRSYPDVFNNTQAATVFIPETFLPAVPLAVGTRQEMEAAMQTQASLLTGV